MHGCRLPDGPPIRVTADPGEGPEVGGAQGVCVVGVVLEARSPLAAVRARPTRAMRASRRSKVSLGRLWSKRGAPGQTVAPVAGGCDGDRQSPPRGSPPQIDAPSVAARAAADAYAGGFG